MPTKPPVVVKPRVPGLAFADAHECREWLEVLPLTNVPEAQAQVLAALRVLNAAPSFGGLERLKCLEMLREKVAYLLAEQRDRYFGKSLPLNPLDVTAWSAGLALIAAMEEGYRVCLSEGETAEHRALIVQRAMRYVGAQMGFHGAIYRRFDGALWTRAHQMYAKAEAEGFAEDVVKDSLGDSAGSTSVATTWARIVLAQAACPLELMGPGMDIVEALLGQWGRKVQVLRELPPEGDGARGRPLVADLESAEGARLARAGAEGDSIRFLDLGELAKSIRRRLRALQNGDDPAGLQLPKEAQTPGILQDLQRLHRLWCEGIPTRPPAKVPKETGAGLVFGSAEVHFFLSGGKVFEQPDKKRELSSREKDDIAMFGRVTERTQSALKVEHNYSVENWGVIDEAVGAWRLLRPASAAKGVAIGRLAAVRLGEGAPFFLGRVTALVQEDDGRIVITLTLFPGRPEPVAVRAADSRNRPNAQWVQGFRLPAIEKMNVPESFVVPPNMVSRGRGLDLWSGGAKELTVYEILDRGADFDRISTF